MTGRRSIEKNGGKRSRASKAKVDAAQSVAPSAKKPANKPLKQPLKQSLKKSEATVVAEPMKLLSDEKEWLELFPQGISVATGLGRPVLILKDKTQSEVLPVWMNPLDAGVALAELSRTSTGSSPHTVAKRLVEVLEMQVESCKFVDLVGHHQWVEIAFRKASDKGSELKILRSRADDSMSFCLQSGARFLASREYMARCRDLDFDLSKLEQSLVSGQLPDLQSELEISSKKQPYMM